MAGMVNGYPVTKFTAVRRLVVAGILLVRAFGDPAVVVHDAPLDGFGQDLGSRYHA
jgi:hypothetical protein